MPLQDFLINFGPVSPPFPDVYLFICAPFLSAFDPFHRFLQNFPATLYSSVVGSSWNATLNLHLEPAYSVLGFLITGPIRTPPPWFLSPCLPGPSGLMSHVGRVLESQL